MLAEPIIYQCFHFRIGEAIKDEEAKQGGEVDSEQMLRK